VSRHLLIAGTGRAGTSFLVRWLGACGLDIGDFGPEAWNDDARAGLERRVEGDDLPYVLKDPWLFTYCRDIDPDRFQFDALIVPVRRLDDVVASRLRQEQAVVSETIPYWDAETWGQVPGGALRSLHPLDQARLLAVGFHEVIQWAVESSIPLVFLSFPRFVQDAWHAVEVLAEFVGDPDAARSAHHRLADPAVAWMAAP
jgi:hypothetical protein